MEQFGKIIKEISSLSKENIIDEVKGTLREKDSGAYSKWREDGFNINHSFYGQDTLLHFTVKYGSAEMVRALVENSANVNSVGYLKKTPLHYAIRYRAVEAVKILIENGADVNAVDEVGDTPLHTAVCELPRDLKVAIVKVLIENNADVNVVSKPNKDTILHSAVALSDSADIARILMENGASVNAVCFWKGTPLHVAAEYGCKKTVDLLMESGADPNVVNGYDKDTPLHLAAKNNHLEVVKCLAGRGADINAKNYDDKTPLDHAREKGYEEIVKYLTAKIAEMSYSRGDALQTYEEAFGESSSRPANIVQEKKTGAEKKDNHEEEEVNVQHSLAKNNKKHIYIYQNFYHIIYKAHRLNR